MNNDMSALRQLIAQSGAVLVLGQDHSPAMIDQIMEDVRALGARPETINSLPALCTYAEHAATDALAAAHSRIASFEPNLPLLELVSLPWAAVVTSAVDEVLLKAIKAVGSQRRIVERCATQIPTTSFGHSGAVLQLVRAFGTLSGIGPEAAPTTEVELRRARRLAWPPVLNTLPALVGLNGGVVVAGFSERDWVDEAGFDALSSVLSFLPPGRVHWIGWAPTAIHEQLEGIAHFFPDDLSQVLYALVHDQPAVAELQAARERVFGVDERVVTVSAGGQPRRLIFSAREWRSLSQVVSVVDDKTIADLLLERATTNRDLRKYLRQSHAGAPDWAGPAHGFIFGRRQVMDLIDSVHQFIISRKPSIHRGTVRRQAFILSGPPATGKTLGLLHAAWTLRATHRHCVLWLLPQIAGVDTETVDRVVRLFHERGAEWTVVVSDDLGPMACARLQHELSSEGRKVVVVGSESRLARRGQALPNDGVRRQYMPLELGGYEAGDLARYFNSHDVPGADSLAATGTLLEAISRAFPEVKFGAMIPLVQEYEEVLRTSRVELERSRLPKTAPLGSLAAQLQALFPGVVQGEGDSVTSTFDADPVLKRLIDTILFCAQVEQPLLVDVALHVIGPELLAKYSAFARTFEATALVQEIHLQERGQEALTTAHQLHAQLLMDAMYPDRVEQLGVLARIAREVSWRPDAMPGEHIPQDFVIEVLRRVGPRGAFSELFRSRRAQSALANILKALREDYSLRLTPLLSLEAIIAGDLAQQTADDQPDMAATWCERASLLLELVVDQLRGRPASGARNFELQRALTLSADIRGTMLNIVLRAPDATVRGSIGKVLPILKEIQRDTMLARSYDSKFHPLDVLAWSHKDAFDLLATRADDATRAGFLATMAAALEVAEEETITSDQKALFNRRRIQLADRRGQFAIGEDLAAQMRADGDLTGELTISRDRVDAASATECAEVMRQEMARLLAFGASVLADLHVVRFLHRLWMKAHSVERLGEGDPVRVAATLDDWHRLAQITGARLSHEEDAANPFVLFCRGWALYQVGEPRAAGDVLALLERHSFGMTRRVGRLVMLTEEDGLPKPFPAQVVKAQSGGATLRVPSLDLVLDVRPEVQRALSPEGLEVGEHVSVEVSLNYRGAQLLAVSDDFDAA